MRDMSWMKRQQQGGAGTPRGLTEENSTERGRDRHLQFAETRAWVQNLLDDISLIYTLVSATCSFCCRWRVEKLERILRTLIAQGREKSFCCVPDSQRCVKVKTTPSHSHAWMLLLFFFLFHQWIENHFIFCPVLLVPCVTNCSMLWFCILGFYRTQNDLSFTRVHWQRIKYLLRDSAHIAFAFFCN